MKPPGEGLGDQETPPPSSWCLLYLSLPLWPLPALLGPWVGAELTCVGLGELGQAGGQQGSLGRPWVLREVRTLPPWREEGLVLARKPTDTVADEPGLGQEVRAPCPPTSGW